MGEGGRELTGFDNGVAVALLWLCQESMRGCGDVLCVCAHVCCCFSPCACACV